MFCPNCGKDLVEGEVCDCMQNHAENTAPEETTPLNETPHEAPQPNYYEPASAPASQGYYDPNAQQSYFDPNTQAQQPMYYPPIMDNVAANTDYPEGYKIKKKYVAVILAASLGFIGIHDFYLGDNGKGIAKILIATLGSLLFGLGAVVSAVWATVDAVLLLTENTDRDANGYKIQTFEEALAEKLKDKE